MQLTHFSNLDLPAVDSLKIDYSDFDKVRARIKCNE